MWRFIKAAFWIRPEIPGLGRLPANVLAVSCFGILGLGHPGFWLLGLGLEAAFLSLLAANPRFQKYVLVTESQQGQSKNAEDAETSLQRILKSFPRETFERFDRLRTRCRDLRQIASDLKHPGDAIVDQTLDDLQLQGLDRLLWVFLRLLFTHQALQRFIKQTDAAAIQQDLDRYGERLRELSAAAPSPQTDKLRHALEDSRQTARERLENVAKARANLEFVELEIDRLESKINSLAELSVNRHEPDFISGQVDQVANSIRDTERTMNDLSFATGLDPLDEQTPRLVREGAGTARGP